MTYYAVFDGHGGAECAVFLRSHLHEFLSREFLDEIEGLKDSEDLNETIANCINKAFDECD